MGESLQKINLIKEINFVRGSEFHGVYSKEVLDFMKILSVAVSTLNIIFEASAGNTLHSLDLLPQTIRVFDTVFKARFF